MTPKNNKQTINNRATAIVPPISQKFVLLLKLIDVSHNR